MLLGVLSCGFNRSRSGTFAAGWLFLHNLLAGLVLAVGLVHLGHGGEFRLALIQAVVRALEESEGLNTSLTDTTLIHTDTTPRAGFQMKAQA